MAGTLAQWRFMRLLEGASDDVLKGLVRDGKSRQLQAGELLLSPKKANKTIYFVVAGQLCVRLNSPDEPAVATITAGQCCGEISILDEQPPSAWVIAAEPTELLCVSRDQLWQLVDDSHAVARNIIYILSQRIRAYRDLVVQHTSDANTDALTGLYNRRWLDEQLPKIFSAGRQEDQAIALLMVDADHFKKFNDSYGHAAGDDALQRLATALRRAVRSNDSVIRYGGEEFTVLLPQSGERRAAKVAERIRKAVAAMKLPIANESLTVSVGVALASRDPQATHSTLLERADAALYEAKETGRNRVVFAH